MQPPTQRNSTEQKIKVITLGEVLHLIPLKKKIDPLLVRVKQSTKVNRGANEPSAPQTVEKTVTLTSSPRHPSELCI